MQSGRCNPKRAVTGGGAQHIKEAQVQEGRKIINLFTLFILCLKADDPE